MYSYIEKIASLMSEEDRREYDRIWAPRVVTVSPYYARRNMCVMPDGELRLYGICDKTDIRVEDSGRRIYMASRDGGLSWKRHECHPDAMGESVRVPWTGEYLTVGVVRDPADGKNKVTRLLSAIGPDDINPRRLVIGDGSLGGDIYQPYFLPDVRRILVTVTRYVPDTGRGNPVVLISDDNGESFRVVEIPAPMRFEQEYPHKSLRWENGGSEPSLTRLPDGRLWMVVRTSTDYMHECFSEDNGDTWSEIKPSPFHMTLTTPFPLTLRDGRVLLFWNNTHPMPEEEKEKQIPPATPDVVDGTWEDVFTNRDISHAAISEDGGKTFFGYRETRLNEWRDRPDFRTLTPDSNALSDKSVHQHQAIEMPYGKVLVCLGQNDLLARAYLFDVRWLYETERKENFFCGMGDVTTHGYLRSISSSFFGKPGGGPGHCHWNRIPTVYAMPDPENPKAEAAQFVFSDDPRLHNGLSGMAWNFPAAKQGHVEVEMYQVGGGLRVSLADEWINPTDEYAGYTAEFSFDVDGSATPKNEWFTLSIDFDTEKKTAVFSVGGRVIGEAPLAHAASNGVCYLHLQTLSRARDFEGSYVRSLLKK